MGKQALCTLALLLVPGLASAASFTPLGFLNGVNNSQASGVSADGSVVVGSSYSARGPQAFRWTGGVMTGLGALPGDAASAANGVSADGTVVVGTSIYVPADSFYEAFQWTAMTGLGGFPGAPPCNSQAFGVSADGAVVVGQCNREAFRWTGGVMTGLGVLPGDIESVANGVSADGAVVVGRSDGKAFRWTGGVMTGLGALPFGTYTEAFGVSADGTTVVGSSLIGTAYEAFAWFGGVMTGLGVLAGDTDSVANGASNTGLVVGHSYAIVQGVLRGQAFVWTPWDGMARLEDVLATNGATGLAGWTLAEANGISADGQWIVGTGINPNGNPQAFLANVSTSPPSVAAPNVVGQTQAAASTAITNAGFVLGTVTPQASSTVASGYVISESPAAGTMAASGSMVNLVVSTGSGSSGAGGGGSGGGGGGALDVLTLSGLLGALAIGMRRRLLKVNRYRGTTSISAAGASMSTPVQRSITLFSVKRRSLTGAACLSSIALFMLAACGGGGGKGNVTSYTVGGEVVGLSGTGLVLRNTYGDLLPIAASGMFTFAARVADSAPFAVTVDTQPTHPAQTCVVTNGSGTVRGNVTSVAVSCVTNNSGTFIGVNYINSGYEGGLGTTIFDGAGHISGTSVGNFAGTISPVATESGTYTVGADGAMTLGSDVGGVSTDGNVMLFETMTIGELAYIDIEIKQGQSNFTNADLTGTYAVVTYSNYGDSGTLWTLIADGSGNFSGSEVQNNAGAISPSSTVAGTYTVALDGALTVTRTGGTPLTGGVSADGSTLVLSQITVGQPPAIVVGIKQGQSNFTSANVSGTYKLATFESSGDFGALLTIAFDGAGNINGTAISSDAGVLVDSAVSGTYAVAAHGALTVSLTGASPLTGGVSADGTRLVLTSLNPGQLPTMEFGIATCPSCGLWDY